MKICKKCGIEKELSGYHKKSEVIDGLQPICKECDKIEKKKYYNKNKERLLNKSKIRYKNNEEQEKLARKMHYLKNKEQVSIDKKKYYETNKEQILNRHSKNKEHRNNYGRKWQIANPGKVNANAAKRRAAKLQRTPKWLTKEDFKKIEAIYKLASTIQKLTSILYDVDHIIPLQGKAVSGLHVPWNLQIITKEENVKKKNKLLIEGAL